MAERKLLKTHTGNASRLGLIAWLAISFLVAFIGSLALPEAGESPLHDYLEVEEWTVLSPVFLVLYLFMGISAWLVWKEYGFEHAKIALSVFLVQLVLNSTWPWIYFEAEAPGWAFIVIMLLLGLVIFMMQTFWQKDKRTIWLLVPYAMWVMYVASLNVSVWIIT